MALKKVSDSSKPKRKVVRVIIEVKMLITAKHESGMHVFLLAVNLFMPKSTICLMLKNNCDQSSRHCKRGDTIN